MVKSEQTTDELKKQLDEMKEKKEEPKVEEKKELTMEDILKEIYNILAEHEKVITALKNNQLFIQNYVNNAIKVIQEPPKP